jgi:ankyrin repeat protein
MLALFRVMGTRGQIDESAQHIADVARLLQGGLDVNKCCRLSGGGIVPLLYLAVQAGSDDVVTIFLDCGADVNAKDGRGGTALMYASDNGLMSMVELLLRHRAIVVDASDDYGWTALNAASFGGHADVVRILLNHGANDNAVDISGKTAMDYATEEGFADVVQLLSSHQHQEAERRTRVAEAEVLALFDVEDVGVKPNRSGGKQAKPHKKATLPRNAAAPTQAAQVAVGKGSAVHAGAFVYFAR